MPATNVICLVVDRLQPSFLGAYGNPWVGTPHIDRLASESFVFDQAIVDSPDLDMLYRSYWRGLHAMVPDAVAGTGPSLPALLAQAGVHAALVTDEPSVAHHPLAEEFAERIALAAAHITSPVAQMEQTALAQFVANAAEWLAGARQPFVLWLHARGMESAWDAPLSFRQRYQEADEDPAGDWAEVPNRPVLGGEDPDQLWEIAQVYAGQVALLDSCIGALLAVFRESPLADKTMFMLASARGIPLGEHGWIGVGQQSLHGVLLHAACLLRNPDLSGDADRSSALVQPADIGATILQACGIDVSDWGSWGQSLTPIVHGQQELLRDRACSISLDERSIRTAAWHLQVRNASSTAQSDFDAVASDSLKLYAKPDDRAEVNEVSARCPDEAALLQTALDEFQRACRANNRAMLKPLDPALSNEVSHW